MTMPSIHVLIETHEALSEVFQIAALSEVSVLDFGLMDFISCHHGTISSDIMFSPGQFEHPLIVRAKTRIVSAAMQFGKVASHNVTIDLSSPKKVREDALRAKNSFSFLRMWSFIHPRSLPFLKFFRRLLKQFLKRSVF